MLVSIFNYRRQNSSITDFQLSFYYIHGTNSTVSYVITKYAELEKRESN